MDVIILTTTLLFFALPCIMEDAKPVVGKLGVILKKFSKFEIRIEGHTDNVPISNRSRYTIPCVVLLLAIG